MKEEGKGIFKEKEKSLIWLIANSSHDCFDRISHRNWKSNTNFGQEFRCQWRKKTQGCQYAYFSDIDSKTNSIKIILQQNDWGFRFFYFHLPKIPLRCQLLLSLYSVNHWINECYSTLFHYLQTNQLHPL